MTRPDFLALVAAASLLVLPALAGEPAEVREIPQAQMTPEITADQILSRMAWLASDALEGRESGSAGGRAAEEYVAAEFVRMGLEPLGTDGTALAPVELPLRTPAGIGNAVDVTLPGGETVATGLGQGAVPFSFSPEGSVEGEVVFAGHGIRAKDQGIDDYDGLEVEGRVVMILRWGPNQDDPESFFSLRNPAARKLMSFREKADVAATRGAVGVLLVDDPRRDPRFGLSTAAPSSDESSIPMMVAPRELADRILATVERSVESVHDALDKGEGPRSFALPGVKARLSVSLGETLAHNAVAVRRGVDEKLADECVLVCAHMDHVGLGWFGSLKGGGEIHNGADDNASGTAALLEVAERLAAAPATRRSIVFAAWCGEEKGLVGSQQYAANPAWPLARTVVCLNMDMVGRYRDGGEKDRGLLVAGAPTGTGLDARVDRLATAHGLRIAHVWDAWQQSDHYSFYRRGIPSLFFTTDLHDDYHQPGDDWWKTASEPQARIASLVADLAVEMANAPDRPEFHEKPKRPVLGVRLGPVEADGVAVDGARIVQVFPAFGAAAAGLKVGDVIVAVDGKRVTSLAHLTELIGAYDAESTVAVSFVRDGEERTANVLLKGI